MNYLEQIVALDWPYKCDNSEESLNLIDFLEAAKGNFQYAISLRERVNGQHPTTIMEGDLVEDEIIEVNGQYIMTGGNKDLLKSSCDLEELATIAAIMGDHMCEKLYKYIQENCNSGYFTTVELIGNWAIEFYMKFESVTEWSDEVFDNPGLWDLSPEVCCWDDCVMEFADQKFKAYKL